MKVGMITMEYFDNREKGTVGSSRIRGDWVVKYWDGAEKYQIGRKYDVLIFQKAYWREMAKAFEGIKIFDLCDPDWLEYKGVVEMIEMCDGVTTSSEALANQLRKFDIKGKPVLCIPDRVDMEWSVPVKKTHEGQARSVVWFGYSTNAKVLDSAVEGLHRRGLTLTVIADAPYHDNDIFVEYKEGEVNSEIVKHDIVLLPKAPSSDYRFQFKSNNKTIQSWALGMPVATNGAELDRFMSAEERNKESCERLEEIRRDWDVKKSVEEYKNFINLLKTRRANG